MNTPIFIFLFLVGHITCYNVQRNIPYDVLCEIDPYSVEVVRSIPVEPSQRLFWDQGSNQVGGNGWWSTLTNKFPFLNKMFGRMELAEQYGPPELARQYIPGNIPPQFNRAQYQQQFLPLMRDAGIASQYGAPQQFRAANFQPQFNQISYPQQFLPVRDLRIPNQYPVPQQQFRAAGNFQPQFNQQPFRPPFVPSPRDVGVTDDAIIVTPPQVPIAPQPAPVPAPQPVPQPAPQPPQHPAPQPGPGYNYDKPFYRLDLPHK